MTEITIKYQDHLWHWTLSGLQTGLAIGLVIMILAFALRTTKR